MHAPRDCSDGDFCNGAEWCNFLNGCMAGAPPDYDDSNTCTNDVCTVDADGNAVCENPCKEDCAICPTGLCKDCVCVSETCTVLLKEITFLSDHAMFQEAAPCDPATGKCWGSSAALSGVDWANINNPNHPAAYTRAATMSMIVRLEVTGGPPGIATLRVTDPDGVTGEGTFSVPCQATVERFTTITTTSLPNVVKAYTPAGLSWSMKCPGETVYRALAGTLHNIYVTFGTPTGSDPTDRRLNFVCNADGNAVAGACQSPVHQDDGISRTLG